MKRNRLIVIPLIMILLLNISLAHYKVEAESIFVCAVQPREVNDGFIVDIIYDLNYQNLRDPNDISDIVDTYTWRNWFVHDDIDIFSSIDNDHDFYDGIYVELTDDTYSDVENTDYLGLPYYIESCSFECNVGENNNLYYVTPQEMVSDYDNFPGSLINLGKLTYPSISTSEIVSDVIDYPKTMFAGDKDRLVRYYDQVECADDGTGSLNSRLSCTLTPNPFYRHTDPSNVGSEDWTYNDILGILPTTANTQSISFSCLTNYNISDGFWEYNTSDEWYDNLQMIGVGSTGSQPLCVDTATGNIYYQSELPQELVNTIDGYECFYESSLVIQSMNEILFKDNKISESIATQKIQAGQIRAVYQKNNIKSFFSEKIIPLISTLLLIVFYLFSFFAIGFTAIAIIPLMYSNFIKGMKKAFDIEDLINDLKVRGKR